MRAAAVLAALAAAIVAGATAPPAVADDDEGWLTSQPPMLKTLVPNSRVKPIITVGEKVEDYRFESIPDGISLRARDGDDDDDGKVDVWVNHETSTVPFPYVPAAPTISNSQNDFDNAQLSHLVLSEESKGVLEGSFAIPSSANFQRFCSNFLATRRQGFSRPLLFTNEEASDLVNRTGEAWPAGPGAEQAGLVVAHDPKTKEFRPIYGLGRMNHENAVAIPGYGHPVLLTGDDTFAAPSSQLYMYIAASSDDVWNDDGHLWAFVPADPAINDYGDLSGIESVAGEFVPVPDDIAGGDQTGLETWSNENNVFQFIRVEDIAYDRRKPNIVYFADTGEPRAIPDTTTGRLKRGPSGTLGPYMNGRIFKLVLDPVDSKKVLSLSVLIDADTGNYGNQNVIHQPDNVETTRGSLLITEDPGSHNQYTAGTGPNARIWRYDFEDTELEPIAMVDQSADPAAKAGAWESTGIVSASGVFGAGAFLVAIQAHTLFVETAPGPDLTPPLGPDWLYKREGGQLLLLRVRD
jgi:uncharacterized protein DUF839